MAEKKPSSKTTTATTTPSSSASSTRRSTSQPEYFSEYDDALTGVSVFAGYWVPPGQIGPPQPRYKTGPGLFKSFLNYSSDKVRAIQEQMYLAGLYGGAKRKDIRWGQADDDATLKAYVTALRSTALNNAKGNMVTLQALLDRAAKFRSASEIAEGGGGGGPTFNYQPPDPAEVRALVQESASATLGSGLGDTEIAALSAEINSRLEAAARSAFGAQVGGGVAAPAFDPKLFAEKRARELRPEQAREFGEFSAANLLSNMVMGGGGDLG